MKNVKRLGRNVISMLLIICMLAGFGLTHINGYADEVQQEEAATESLATEITDNVETVPSDTSENTAVPVETAVIEQSGVSSDDHVTETGSAGIVEEVKAENSSVSDVVSDEAITVVEETPATAEDNNVVDDVDSAEAVVEENKSSDVSEENEDIVNSSEVEPVIASESSSEAADYNTAAVVETMPGSEEKSEAEKEDNSAFYYEVDFSYDGNKFVLQGDTSKELDTVLNQLGLSGEVNSVVSSNPELFSCEQVDGVWMISANSAFTSDENLTVTLEDGSVLELSANDDFAGNSSGKIMCVYDDETKTLTIKLADGEDTPVLENLEGESDEERNDRISAYAVQDLGGEKGVLKSLKSIVEKIVLMEGVTGIGWDEDRGSSKGVFQEFTALTEVEASSTLMNIGFSAFRKCTNLKVFDFASCTNLETIRQQAFSRTDLEVADMSECENLESIGRGAFESISSLESVTIPTAVKVIDDTAFQNCTGIETVVYNAVDYEYCITNNSKNTQPWFSSSTFKSSAALELEVGSDVENLPRGFFKAFAKAGEQVSFAGKDDGDPDTVSGRIVTLHDKAAENGVEPFKSFPSEVIVDENGVLYKNTDDGIEMLYVSPGITQYIIPDEITVDGDAIAQRTEDYSSFGRVIRYSIEADNSRNDVTFESIPAFRISGSVLAVSDKVNALGAEDLSGLTYTAAAADGTMYRYELIGWACGEEEIELGAEMTVNCDAEILLTARWSETVIPAEQDDETDTSDDSAPAETEAEDDSEIQDTADTQMNVAEAENNTESTAPAVAAMNNPAVVQVARAAENVSGEVKEDPDASQMISEEITEHAYASGKVEELSARLETTSENQTVEEIIDNETPLSASAGSEVYEIGMLSLALIMIILAIGAFMVIIRRESENN